jgi:mono/diheme cytochrome c family protein
MVWPRAQAALTPEQLAQLPSPAARVNFGKDIAPILESSCANCHGRGKARGGFQIDTRETFLKEADSGPAVIPGNSRESHLIHLVSGLDPDNVMPQKGTRLTAEQVGLMRAWIDQGLPWEADVTFARDPHRNLTPRRPDLPPASADLTHPVDRLVWAYFQRERIVPPSLVDDRTFARRVYQDVIGLFPTPEELNRFLEDSRPDKRERLVDEVLSDTSRYAQHWLTFWNDLLRNDYRGTGYIDGGREQITRWLYTALVENKPYDAFVAELVNPAEDGPRGFTKGIVWRGVVNASQRPPVQAAQNISQVFLGVNLKCASCHDSFIDDWQLADAYGMASIYSEEPLELVQCDKPLGRHAPAKFLFPEIGSINDDLPMVERISRLAELVTSPDNGRLSRTVVNRLWARLLGRGLVEPLDVMQNAAWDQDLLDWLAEDFVESGYDLKHTLDRILTSRAYQLPAVNLAEQSIADFRFLGPTVRRLTAEQFRDALGQLTGVWHDKPEGGLDGVLFEEGQPEPLPADAFWIWSDPHAASGVPPQTVYFRKTIELPAEPADAIAFVNADNTHRLWVNGREVRRKNDIPWAETSVLDLRSGLRKGANTFALEATNAGDSPNPAGILFYARLRLSAPGETGLSGAGSAKDAGDQLKDSGTAGEGQVLDFGSDSSWRVINENIEGWQRPEFDASEWARAQVLGPPDMEPWQLGTPFASKVSGRSVYGKVRASLVAADPMTRALGRPNREQVTSSRPYTATTLQMLELTNGETLARILESGAENIIAQAQSGEAVVNLLFQRGLGRAPTGRETELALELVGAEPKPDGVEDLLWAVAMLPEFQLIH